VAPEVSGEIFSFFSQDCVTSPDDQHHLVILICLGVGALLLVFKAMFFAGVYDHLGTGWWLDVRMMPTPT